MHILFVGGTKWVGLEAAKRALDESHTVTIAHSGAHEALVRQGVAHLHGQRGDLLAAGGPIELAKADVIVDTFGGSTTEKGRELGECAVRCGARVVAVSSCDVYQALTEAGLGDGSARSLLWDHTLPIDEEAPLRAEAYPGSHGHDNVAMETALLATGANVTALRPGAIYGIGDPLAREWPLVRRVKAGEHRIELPAAGVQLFHRVSNERVSRAIVAAAGRTHAGFWACNVVDPYSWTYAGLAAQVGRILDWEWEPVSVGFSEAKHPFQLSAPALFSDRRLREELGVKEPDPREALETLVRHYYEHGPREGAAYAEF
jgi:nucleoside-diphosphate-sugar epimerase